MRNIKEMNTHNYTMAEMNTKHKSALSSLSVSPSIHDYNLCAPPDISSCYWLLYYFQIVKCWGLHPSYIPSDVYCSNSSISSDRSLQCSKVTNPLKKKKYDCYSQGSTIDWHTCTPQSLVCPLHAANILESMKRMKMTTFTSSICNFDDALRAKSISTVNIIVLGGSVTNGVSAFGCNCLQTEDPLCPLNTTKQQCKWSSYLDSWTQEYISPRIRVINLSVRGFTSSLMSDNIFFFLKREISS